MKITRYTLFTFLNKVLLTIRNIIIYFVNQHTRYDAVIADELVQIGLTLSALARGQSGQPMNTPCSARTCSNIYKTFTLVISHYYRHFRLDLNPFTGRK